MADGDLQHNGTRAAGQHELWSHQQQQHHHSTTNNPFLAMRLPHGLFPYTGGMAGHPTYAAHPAALAAHHAAAAAAWNNLKSGNPIAAAAAAAGFQPLPRYWLHPHWPAHSAVFDPVAMSAHPEAGSSPPQHVDYSSFVLQSQQQISHHHQFQQQGDSRSPVSSPASSLQAGDSPTPEPMIDNKMTSNNVDKAILDLRVKIAGPGESPVPAKRLNLN